MASNELGGFDSTADMSSGVSSSSSTASQLERDREARKERLRQRQEQSRKRYAELQQQQQQQQQQQNSINADKDDDDDDGADDADDADDSNATPLEALKKPAPLRPDMVANAVRFLSNPQVQATPIARRIAFLEQKGMHESEHVLVVAIKEELDDTSNPLDRVSYSLSRTIAGSLDRMQV